MQQPLSALKYRNVLHTPFGLCTWYNHPSLTVELSSTVNGIPLEALSLVLPEGCEVTSEEGNQNGANWHRDGGSIELQVQDDPFPLELQLKHHQNLLRIGVVAVKDENGENVIFDLQTVLKNGNIQIL